MQRCAGASGLLFLDLDGWSGERDREADVRADAAEGARLPPGRTTFS